MLVDLMGKQILYTYGSSDQRIKNMLSSRTLGHMYLDISIVGSLRT